MHWARIHITLMKVKMCGKCYPIHGMTAIQISTLLFILLLYNVRCRFNLTELQFRCQIIYDIFNETPPKNWLFTPFLPFQHRACIHPCVRACVRIMKWCVSLSKVSILFVISIIINVCVYVRVSSAPIYMYINHCWTVYKQ